MCLVSWTLFVLALMCCKIYARIVLATYKVRMLPYIVPELTDCIQGYYLTIVFTLSIQTLLLPSIIVLHKKGKRRVQGVPQSQTAALPRNQEEEETDKSKQAQIDQTYVKN